VCVVCRGFVSARQEHHVQAGYPQVLSTYVCCKPVTSIVLQSGTMRLTLAGSVVENNVCVLARFEAQTGLCVCLRTAAWRPRWRAWCWRWRRLQARAACAPMTARPTACCRWIQAPVSRPCRPSSRRATSRSTPRGRPRSRRPLRLQLPRPLRCARLAADGRERSAPGWRGVLFVRYRPVCDR
jgi:hypothetical protein